MIAFVLLIYLCIKKTCGVPEIICTEAFSQLVIAAFGACYETVFKQICADSDITVGLNDGIRDSTNRGT